MGVKEKKQVTRSISLGGTCQTVIGLKDLFDHQPRLPFDYSTISHYTLCFLLENKFQVILNPREDIELESNFRINFYNHINGFYFGHQKLEEIKEIHEKIKRRCLRFLDLIDKNEAYLFVRQRDINWDNDKWSENLYKETILDEIIKEYDELKQALINFGIKNFELLYVISSPIQTLDGFITIEEGEIAENIYSIDFLGPVDEKNWGKIREEIENKFAFSCL